MIEQPAVVDDNGDIFLHGRQGASIILEFKDIAGAVRDVSAVTITFEVGPTLNIPLTNVAGQVAQKKLTLTNANIKSIYEAKDRRFVFLETKTDGPDPVWRGMVYIDGWVE